MRSIVRSNVACSVAGLICLISLASSLDAENVQNGTAKETDTSIIASVRLTDGSRLNGHPSAREIVLSTAYGDLRMPLQSVSTVTIETNRQVVLLRNGDRLEGRMSDRTFRMETIFGKVEIGLDAIVQLGFNKSAAKGTYPIDGLVLYYRFDGDEVVIFDESGNSNNGKATDVAWQRRGNGGEAKFGGQKSYITVSASDTLSLDGKAFSIAVWIAVENIQNVMIATKAIAPVPRETLDGQFLVLMLYRDGRALFTFHGRTEDVYYENTPAFWLEQRHHLAATYDPVGKIARLFIDGELQGSKQMVLGLSNTDKGDLCLGASLFDLRGTFKGTMDDVMIFNRALSGDEVRKIYDDQK